MNLREFYVARWKDEGATFIKVLESMPEGQGGYRPHERSRSAAELAWTLAQETQAVLALIERGVCEWEETPPPSTIREIVESYRASQATIAERAEHIDNVAWKKPAQLMTGGQVVWEQPLGEMLWYLLFDAIHHRGQLSTYLRPMGGKVPAIYGPSADDSGQG